VRLTQPYSSMTTRKDFINRDREREREREREKEGKERNGMKLVNMEQRRIYETL